MIFYDSSAFSKATYARFRSSLALERFVTGPTRIERNGALGWSRAWLLIVNPRKDEPSEGSANRDHAVKERQGTLE